MDKDKKKHAKVYIILGWEEAFINTQCVYVFVPTEDLLTEAILSLFVVPYIL